MRQAITDAVLRRADYRCAWCACKLNTGRTADTGTVLRLESRDAADSVVASCITCAAEYSRWWTYTLPYSTDNAKRLLGRCPRTGSGPFVDYLEVKTKGRGYLLPFNTALARIEAQRNAPLDLRRKVA